ncbi:MAG: hypothetical protein HJJLKODD_01066 [Phycisphaerae bacterium]|nr:hypothetical protein [Phycisphaerae bacterium]
MIRRWLARHLFYPVHEALCGRDTLHYLQQLRDSQWLAEDALQELALHKLQGLLHHAADQVPFYQARFLDAGFDPQAVKHLDDLQKLPILTKDEIRTHREQMLAAGVKTAELTESCTSGSSGSPLRFWIDRRRARSDPAARRRCHQWFGIEPGDRGVYLWGSTIELNTQDRLKQMRDWLINETLLNAFDLDDVHLRQYVERLLVLQPDYLYSYASTLWRLAEYVRTQQPELKGLIRRVAFATGEQLLPHWRDEIIQALECSVAEEYGCREGGLIAHECPAGAYHQMLENVVVEILDEAGRPVPDGVEGRMVITNLEAWAMPFIRYDTGDRAARRAGLCECGVRLPRLWRPTGRSFEFLVTNTGARITGVSISRDLKNVEGLAHYRVIQLAPDRVQVQVVPNFRFQPERGTAEIVRYIQARLGPATQVEIELLDQLPAHPSGKYRYVINAIPTASD